MSNQFRHKWKCKCGEDIGCRCYDTLESALEGVSNGLICEKCSIDGIIWDLSTDDLIFYLDKERTKKANDYLISLITKEEIEAYMKETELEDEKDIIIDEIIEGTDKEDLYRDYVIELLTDEEKRDIMFDNSDCDAEGESCEI